MECSEAIHRIDVESCEEMYQAATAAFKESDAAILCAAVADFRPEQQAKEKIKRETHPQPLPTGRGESGLTLRLVPNPDIAAALGKMKTEKQVLVGFALETNDELAHAQEKLQRKHLDFIVMNSLNDEGAGFQHDTNKVTIITPTERLPYPLKPKREVASDIIDQLVKLF
jgi:phosphopantothenoylcysteine decarboxylase/phosphopantothenate--cysteine ligase